MSFPNQLFPYFSGRGVEIMDDKKDSFSENYRIKDNTRKDKYPLKSSFHVCFLASHLTNLTFHIHKDDNFFNEDEKMTEKSSCL